ncbi:2'-5' RNA ligase family protein [Jiulongibacter sediminis]|nr:2'-5' RNA ligase family protein [Jiulongibacter sediminis]
MFKVEEECEILLFLTLPPEAESIIKDQKKEFRDLLGNEEFSHSKPHITLLTWKVTTDRLVSCSKKLSTTLACCQPFSITISGVDAFVSKKSKTMYSIIKNPEQLDNVYKQLSSLKQQPGSGSYFKIYGTPHITIGQSKIENKGFDTLLTIFQKDPISFDCLISEYSVRINYFKRGKWSTFYEGKLGV